jgi:hypothetical protein
MNTVITQISYTDDMVSAFIKAVRIQYAFMDYLGSSYEDGNLLNGVTSLDYVAFEQYYNAAVDALRPAMEIIENPVIDIMEAMTPDEFVTTMGNSIIKLLNLMSFLGNGYEYGLIKYVPTFDGGDLFEDNYDAVKHEISDALDYMMEFDLID